MKYWITVRPENVYCDEMTKIPSQQIMIESDMEAGAILYGLNALFSDRMREFDVKPVGKKKQRRKKYVGVSLGQAIDQIMAHKFTITRAKLTTIQVPEMLIVLPKHYSFWNSGVCHFWQYVGQERDRITVMRDNLVLDQIALTLLEEYGFTVKTGRNDCKYFISDTHELGADEAGTVWLSKTVHHKETYEETI